MHQGETLALRADHYSTLFCAVELVHSAHHQNIDLHDLDSLLAHVNYMKASGPFQLYNLALMQSLLILEHSQTGLGTMTCLLMCN